MRPTQSDRGDSCDLPGRQSVIPRASLTSLVHWLWEWGISEAFATNVPEAGVAACCASEG